MQPALSLRLLDAMFFEAARSRPPGRNRLCLKLGATSIEVDAALLALEQAGLADARRARLTLTGLAIAAAQRAAPRRRTRISAALAA